MKPRGSTARIATSKAWRPLPGDHVLLLIGLKLPRSEGRQLPWAIFLNSTMSRPVLMRQNLVLAMRTGRRLA